ncbi:MAG: transposase [Candidatus Omnitrophica bacterium]|nr:transposase [Candidatus Omnitrophota bacterium]
MRRKPLGINKVYHVFSKSIAGFVIFNEHAEYARVVETIKYYNNPKPLLSFSVFKAAKKLRPDTDFPAAKETLVNIIAYCVMPTHLHLVLQQLTENGISIFMGNTLNSYTKFFNGKYGRKGPLWSERFKIVEVGNDDQLLHLTRYVHLNPVTAYLVDKPEDWEWSSYAEYVSNAQKNTKLCTFERLLTIKPAPYRDFVEGRIDYQRELGKIKSLTLD